MIADWLQRHLENCGLWDIDGYRRAARARRCRSCGHYVLIGLDGDQMGLPVAVDPEPLSPQGEAVAMVIHRATFSLRFVSDRLELDRRGFFEMRGEADHRNKLRHDVLAQHECGTIPIGINFGEPSRLAPPRKQIPVDQPPLF